MLRNLSVRIFALVAVLLISSDASAGWRSRRAGHGYYAPAVAAAVAAPAVW